MSLLQVYEPPMCCTTGICGPSIDPALPQFAADLVWLREQGIKVERYNLAQQPEAFAQNELVKGVLEEDGDACLPLTLAGGKVIGRGQYLSREVMLAAFSIARRTDSLYSESVEELVAIGASIASNCEPCLRYHFSQASRLGISNEDIVRAVATARAVKAMSAGRVLSLAERLTNTNPERELVGASCCGPQKDGQPCC